MKKSRIGSSVDSWLRDEGIYEQASSRAIKRVLARQLQAAMAAQQVTKVEMARRMGSSRSALDRLLDGRPLRTRDVAREMRAHAGKADGG